MKFTLAQVIEDAELNLLGAQTESDKHKFNLILQFLYKYIHTDGN